METLTLAGYTVLRVPT